MNERESPPVRASGVEPAPVDGCRICYAALRDRAAAWTRGDTRDAESYGEPPNRAVDRDSPALAELRERVRADCESRRRLGPLGRKL